MINILTRTVQNPSTVQRIRLTQLTLLYRQLLPEIETGYCWTVWKIQLCETIKLLEVCYFTSQWTWFLPVGSDLIYTYWAWKWADLKFSSVSLGSKFIEKIRLTTQAKPTVKLFTSQIYYDCSCWYEEEETQTPQRLLYLKTYEWVFLEKYSVHHKWVNSEIQAFCQIPHLALSPVQWQNRLLPCLMLPDYLAATTQSLFTAHGARLGQLCTRGWGSFKGCQGAAPIPSVFPP